MVAEPQPAHALPSALTGGWWRRQKLSTGIALLPVAVIVLALLYGLAPGLLPSAGMQQFFLGLARCYSEHLPAVRCDALAQPAGYMTAFGLPYVLSVAVLDKLGFPLLFAGKVVEGFFLAVACGGSVALGRALGMRFSIALLITALFLINPIVFTQDSYGPLRLGFALVPLYVWIDLLLATKVAGSGSARICVANVSKMIAVLAVARTTALFMDGYSFMMALALSGGLILPIFLDLVLRRKGARALALMAGISVPTVIAYIVYRSYAGGAVENAVMPIDFFRGQGVDLFALAVPSAVQWWAEATGFHHDLNGWKTFSDGPNVTTVYVGVILTLAVFTAPFFLFRSGRSTRVRFYAAPLMLVFVVSLIMALGPSLKIADFRNDPPPSRSIRFADYFMPESAATASLGTDWLYQDVPGVRNMRAVHRWMLLVKLTMLLIVGLLLERLFGSQVGRWGSAVLALLLIIDSLPNVSQRIQRGERNFNHFHAFRQDALESLRGFGLEGNRVMLLPYNLSEGWNHFAANYLCPLAELKCINLGGDKSLVQAGMSWPMEIRELSRGRWIASNLADVMASGFVDEILVPLFSLRGAAYRWPPSPQQVEVAFGEAMELARTAGLSAERRGWFVRLQPSPGRQPQIPEVSATSELKIERWGPRAGSFSSGFNVQMDGRSSIWVLFEKGHAPLESYLLKFGGTPLETFNSRLVLSGKLPSRLDRNMFPPGMYDVEILDRATGDVTTVGQFELVDE